jgi:DcmR-like sensory protein
MQLADAAASLAGPERFARCYAAAVQPTCLADAQFRDHFHVCAFVTSAAEERALIDPFFVEGLRRGEKAVYYVDPDQRDEHEIRLRASARSPEMVEVTTWQDAHLKGGSFDQDRMMSALEEMIRDNAASGNPAVRLVGQMGWVFTSPPGIEQLVEYEASVNEVLNRGKTPTVCVYDVCRLSGSMMMDLLRVHPLAVVNGVFHENPFYTPANELLRDIRRRRAMS